MNDNLRQLIELHALNRDFLRFLQTTFDWSSDKESGTAVCDLTGGKLHDWIAKAVLGKVEYENVPPWVRHVIKVISIRGVTEYVETGNSKELMVPIVFDPHRSEIDMKMFDAVIGVMPYTSWPDLRAAWKKVKEIRARKEIKRQKAHQNFNRDVRWCILRRQGKSCREIGKVWAKESAEDFREDLKNYLKKNPDEEVSERDFLRLIYPKTIAEAVRRFEVKIQKVYP